MSAPPEIVLLVEDGRDLGPLLRDTLEEWNHPTVLARTGAEALAAMAREPVGLLLLDHQLPDMSAPELLETLRSQGRAIPPVVLIGAGLSRAAVSRWAEVVAVLPKPFDLDDLAALLRRHLPCR
jgi:DNA-binding response OmpR family regulator